MLVTRGCQYLIGFEALCMHNGPCGWALRRPYSRRPAHALNPNKLEGSNGVREVPQVLTRRWASKEQEIRGGIDGGETGWHTTPGVRVMVDCVSDPRMQKRGQNSIGGTDRAARAANSRLQGLLVLEKKSRSLYDWRASKVNVSPPNDHAVSFTSHLVLLQSLSSTRAHFRAEGS